VVTLLVFNDTVEGPTQNDNARHTCIVGLSTTLRHMCAMHFLHQPHRLSSTCRVLTNILTSQCPSIFTQ
jgi:hypothetical protein